MIGKLALNDSAASPLWGYLWRFIGNGGAMGMAFAFVPWRSVRSGIIYGIAICCCLFLTLLIAPGAQDALFHLTPLTALMALLGHIIYGSVVGKLLRNGEIRAVDMTLVSYSESPLLVPCLYRRDHYRCCAYRTRYRLVL